jgi:hypothetical protein
MRGQPCPERIDGKPCGRPIFAREVCRLHYHRMFVAKKGEPDDPLYWSRQGRFKRVLEAARLLETAETEADYRRAEYRLRRAALSYGLAVWRRREAKDPLRVP